MSCAHAVSRSAGRTAGRAAFAQLPGISSRRRITMVAHTPRPDWPAWGLSEMRGWEAAAQALTSVS
jgi:hypothetical protein